MDAIISDQRLLYGQFYYNNFKQFKMLNTNKTVTLF